MCNAIHRLTSPIQYVSRLAVSTWWPGVAGLYDAYNWMSSAYLWDFIPCLLNIRCIGMVQRVNMTGPRSEPCGTPICSGIVADVFESIWTQWVRSSKYVRNHDNAVSRTPYSSCNTCGGACYFDGYLDSVHIFSDSPLVVVYVHYVCQYN